MHSLIVASSKYGFYLMLLIAFPVMLCVHPILHFWLGIVPEHTVGFVYIMLLIGIFNPLASSLIISIHATGNIRKFQIYEGSSLLMVLPISYLLLKHFHITPEGVMLVYLCVEMFTLCIRIWIVLPQVSMDYIDYFKKVLLPILPPLVCFSVPLFFFSASVDMSFFNLLQWGVISEIYILICIITLGMNALERSNCILLIQKIRKKLFK